MGVPALGLQDRSKQHEYHDDARIIGRYL